MFVGSTGSCAGKVQKIVHTRAKPIVKMLAAQPSADGTLNFRVAGKNRADLPLAMRRAAGNANVMSWRITPVPMNALNAVEEPRYTQPIKKMTNALAQRAQTGTSHLLLTWESFEDPMNPLSRANAHVNLEAVCGHQ